MNRKERRQLHRHGHGLSLEGKFRLYSMQVGQHAHGPLTPFEIGISAKAVALVEDADFYHGGAAGLDVGQMLLPASETGMDPRGQGGTLASRAAYVYSTPNQSVAEGFAEKASGQVYRVKPEGELSSDPMMLRTWVLIAQDRETSFRTKMIPELIEHFCSERARIVEVMK